MKLFFVLLHLSCLFCLTSLAKDGTNPKSFLETKNWLDDATTIPFGKRADERNIFSGARLLFEPQFGHVFQTVDNRVVTKDYNSLLKFGFETNLYMGYIALQGLIIFPSTVQMDELSMVRKNGHIVDPGSRVNVDYGLGVGLSLFNGIIAVGYGGLFFDRRGFTNMVGIPKTTFNYQTNFVYFALQPVSALKAVIQNTKKLAAESE